MVSLIGIDCATQPNKVGLALGELDGEHVRIKACRTGSPKEAPASIVSSWLKRGETALLEVQLNGDNSQVTGKSGSKAVALMAATACVELLQS